MKFNLILFSLLLITIESSFSQNILGFDSLKITNRSSLNTGYNRYLNVHNFNSVINSNYEVSKFSFSLQNLFTSTLIEGTYKNIRDNNQFLTSIDYQFFNATKSGAIFKSRIITDNRKIGISDISENLFGVFIKYVPYRNSELIPLFGYKTDKQLENLDKGLIYGFDGTVKNLDLENYLFSTGIKYFKEDLSRRSNLTSLLKFEVKKNFTEDIANNLGFEFNQSKRDFYLRLDSISSAQLQTDFNLESRNERNFFFNENLVYNNIFSFINLNFYGNIYFRTIDRDTRYKLFSNPSKNIFDTKVNEFRLNLTSNIEIDLSYLNSKFKINYLERDEKHSVKNISEIPKFFFDQREKEEFQKNNSSIALQIGSDNALGISRGDTLFLNCFFSKLKYDTPSEFNYDDRDELLILSRITYKKHFSNYFWSEVFLEAYLNHIVYIFAERSSNNNWNRVLRLASSAKYQNSRFRNKSSAEVLANYTIYDFEDIVPNIQSYSFRQFSFSDSLEFFFSKELFVKTSIGTKLSEQGGLNWKSFSTIPMRYLEEYTGELKLGIKFNSISFFDFGVKIYSFSDFKYEKGSKKKSSEILSYGPTASVTLRFQNRISMDGFLWYETTKESNSSERKNLNLSMTVQYEF
ncbi:MAG: hypothetical protein N3A61_03570 [Ignavibacteria bacterium]|nr:hypothetical protein [Ignavibacteria bacterium]